ncbi:uncharacterized protein LOC125075699 [Vanessa atalanta]|uniref:uncharacterized protein LOC125075699 n=1 Tax=Vanessa atalanta TaxID=42275 RepID=UPI001FCE2E5E|nr:uncharacterized protein LOC125075699 [Vanessa atalanta]
MDSIKQSLAAMTELFNNRMQEFQHDLNKTSSPGSTTSLASDFITFKSFVISALNTLQCQVEFLGRRLDHLEMRHRRKMLLLHGVPEEKTEDISARVTGLVADHLLLPNFSSASIKHSYRLGQRSDKKPRPIVVKFTDVSIRDKVWFAKTKFKGTGLTQSEFLTKSRHDVFLEARRRFGINKCWTRDGFVYVIASDGARHRVESLSDLNSIPTASTTKSPVQTKSCDSKGVDKVIVTRTKRLIKK